MTYFYKAIPVDTDAERKRISSIPRYPKGARKALYEMLDLLDEHKIHEAQQLTVKWPREWREFIGREVWRVLWDYVMEERRPVGRYELVKSWAERDRKGLPT